MTKISDLTDVTTVQADDTLVLVRGGNTRRASSPFGPAPAQVPTNQGLLGWELPINPNDSNQGRPLRRYSFDSAGDSNPTLIKLARTDSSEGVILRGRISGERQANSSNAGNIIADVTVQVNGLGTLRNATAEFTIGQTRLSGRLVTFDHGGNSWLGIEFQSEFTNNDFPRDFWVFDGYYGGTLYLEAIQLSDASNVQEYTEFGNRKVQAETDFSSDPTVNGERVARVSDITPIGGYLFVQTDLSGAGEPDPENYILLTAGEDGAGEYNEGKLTNESVSGSAPLVEATAEISDSESPMNGQTVHLLNTENRYLQPGESPGTVANDQMQQITGTIDASQSGADVGENNSSGAFTTRSGSLQRASSDSGTNWAHDFNSADSPNARTGDHTNVKRLIVTTYQRIK